MRPFLLSLMVIAPLYAAVAKSTKPGAYVCEVLEAPEEYAVEINMVTQKAAFFDNDAWSVIRQTNVKFLETEPSQIEFIFSGKEKSGAKLRVVLNLPRFEGEDSGSSITYQSDGQMQRKVLSCTKVKPEDLGSGI